MGLWAKSIDIFNAIREHGKQSIRSLADRTGLTRGACRALLLVRQPGVFRDTTKGLRIPSVSRLSLLLGHACLTRTNLAFSQERLAYSVHRHRGP